jgi:hypothetical protein
VKTPFEILAQSGVPLLMIGGHALIAHGCPRDPVDFDSVIAAANEVRLRDHLARQQWGEVYRTRFFGKYRPLNQNSPALEVMFVDDTTFEKLLADSFEHDFGPAKLRVPSLMHVVAMKLQVIKHERNRETADLPEIARLLRVNTDRWQRDILEQTCKRFGPRGIYVRLIEALGKAG